MTVAQFATFVLESGYKTDAEREGWSFGLDIKNGKFDFEKLMDDKKMAGCSWHNPGFEQKGDYPVVQVSWNDAKAFCNWLAKRTGKTVKLPTEAQWEYACRAGTKTAYPWGNDPDDGKGWANCADQSLKKHVPNAPDESPFSFYHWFTWDDGFVFTSPTASFKTNAFGLYDMTGNAWQWCHDYYEDYMKGVATDPTGASTPGCCVLRGGSWRDDSSNCRSASRNWGTPIYRSGSTGFRVVVGIE